MLKFKNIFISIDFNRIHEIILKFLVQSRFPSTISFMIHMVTWSHLAFQIFSVCAFGILLWLRIDWGFEEWLHEAYFYNFWHGVYFLLSGMMGAKQEKK